MTLYLCTPHTSSSQNAGSEETSVTVSVTQTCQSVAYMTYSLTHVATSVLIQHAHLTNYQEVGTVDVTVNGSVYQQQTARLNVSLAGVWVYHMSPSEIQQLVRKVAGESTEKATATLSRLRE